MALDKGDYIVWGTLSGMFLVIMIVLVIVSMYGRNPEEDILVELKGINQSVEKIADRLCLEIKDK